MFTSHSTILKATIVKGKKTTIKEVFTSHSTILKATIVKGKKTTIKEVFTSYCTIVKKLFSICIQVILQL